METINKTYYTKFQEKNIRTEDVYRYCYNNNLINIALKSFNIEIRKDEITSVYEHLISVFELILEGRIDVKDMHYNFQKRAKYVTDAIKKSNLDLSFMTNKGYLTKKEREQILYITTVSLENLMLRKTFGNMELAEKELEKIGLNKIKDILYVIDIYFKTYFIKQNNRV